MQKKPLATEKKTSRVPRWKKPLAVEKKTSRVPRTKSVAKRRTGAAKRRTMLTQAPAADGLCENQVDDEENEDNEVEDEEAEKVSASLYQERAVERGLVHVQTGQVYTILRCLYTS